MSTTKDMRLARFVKTILDVVFGALVFACIGLVVWITLSPVILKQTGIVGTVSVPVQIGSAEESWLKITFNSPAKEAIQASFLDDAQGTLRLETSSILMLFIANAALLLVGIGLAYIFYLLRVILKNILEGKPFAPDNGKYLSRLGYAVLLLSIVRPTVEYIASMEILNQLQSSTPALHPGPTFRIETVLTALLILLLSYIWNYGLELEIDKALTV